MKEKLFYVLMHICLVISFTISCLIFVGICYGITILLNVTFYAVIPITLWFIVTFFTFVFARAASISDESMMKKDYCGEEQR